MSKALGLNDKPDNEQDFWRDYDPGQFERLSVAVDILIFAIGEKKQDNARKLPEKELRILLKKRQEFPDKNRWALPGGFVDPAQSLEQAAYEKLKQKTGLKDLYLEQLYTFGEAGRDPRTRVISCSYLALVDAARVDLPMQSETTGEAGWFTVVCALISDSKTFNEEGYTREQQYVLILEGQEQLKAQIQLQETLAGNIVSRKSALVYNEGIAFDHAAMIWTGIERLRNKLEYTSIAFSLMPRLFTLTELQQVYEAILGRELTAANFRRKIGHLVEETRHTRSDYQHRPARLFRFRPDN